MENMDMNMAMLAAARDAWLAAAQLRATRARCMRFAYGDQWSDPLPDCDNMAEGDVALRTGRRPMTNNLIRQLVKTVIGRYRAMADEKKTYVAPPGSAVVRNQLAELDSRMLEEFLVSGCAVQRVVAERRMQGTGVWVDNVAPDRFFVNDYRDPRGFDVELCGMLHDMSPGEVVARFGGGDAGRAGRIRRVYASEGVALPGIMAGPSVDFLTPAQGKWRVVELWTLDAVAPRRGARRKGGTAEARFVWQCRWLAPDGTLLASYASPFAHGQHPFAIKHYPLVDGQVHSFVGDLLGQQRCINRLITIIDHIMSCSAKGVLLFPTDQLPPDVSWQEVTDAWASADGVIPITGRGQLPQQMVTGNAASGAYQLLSLQMQLFDTMSGVGDALSGRTDAANRSEGLYEAQVRNATIALYDLLLTFEAFTAQRDEKMKNC